MNDKNEMECIDKKTGQKCKFNEKTKKVDCSATVAVKITKPTVTISQVNNMGLFYVTFSEPMNMTKFLNVTVDKNPQSRSLRSSLKANTIPVLSASEELENSYKYLFNSSYIDLKTVSGGSVNSTMLNYTW